MPPQRTRTRKSHRHKPIPGKHLTPYERGKIVGMRIAHTPLHEISETLHVPLTTVANTCNKDANSEYEHGKEKRGRGRPRKTTEAQDEQILQTALEDRHQNYVTLQYNLAPEISISESTIKRRLHEQNLKKWRAMERSRLDTEDAEKRLDWAIDHRHWTKEMWRKRCMWGDEVTVERGGSTRPEWIFRYPREKWKKECIEPRTRTSERKISQHMTGAFMGGKYGYFLPVFGDPTSEGGGITAKSLIRAYGRYFIRMWKEMVREANGEVIYFIIDNARNHGPVRRWLLERGVVFKEIPPYSPDLNPIEHIWALIKNLLQKLYPELYLVSEKDGARKMVEEAITHCWELLDSEIFDTLAESMVDRVQAVIEAEGWYTKY